MKSIIVITFTLLYFHVGSAQSFEGKVIYKNSFKSNSPGISDARLDSLYGNTQEYYIKGGNYKSVSNGTFVQAQLYVNSENKFYSKTTNVDTFQATDASGNPDEVLNTELKKNVLEVLGYPCDELILTCKSGVQKFFFNAKLSIVAELYKNHLYGNWFAYLQLANALPLKMIVDNQQFHMESEAVEILPLNLEENAFQLAPDKRAFKFPSNALHWTLLETKVFKIYFPAKPSEDVQTVESPIGVLKVKNYTYEAPSVEPDPNYMYSVGDTDYPDSLVRSDKIEILDEFFDGSIKGLVDNTLGKLISKSTIQKDNFPGRAIKIDFHNGLAIFNVKMYLVKNKMIMLQTITLAKNDPNTWVDKFMDSFSLNK
ncbi:MAG: hypothetical protein ABI761_09740 [Saprospiraceae bacterium]